MGIFNGSKLPAALVLAALVSGCGGSLDQTCDEVRAYQLAREHRRVEAPEGLDQLDPMKELPLPEASPRAPRPAGSPCLDRPPAISLSDGGDEEDEQED